VKFLGKLIAASERLSAASKEPAVKFIALRGAHPIYRLSIRVIIRSVIARNTEVLSAVKLPINSADDG